MFAVFLRWRRKRKCDKGEKLDFSLGTQDLKDIQKPELPDLFVTFTQTKTTSTRVGGFLSADIEILEETDCKYFKKINVSKSTPEKVKRQQPRLNVLILGNFKKSSSTVQIIYDDKFVAIENNDPSVPQMGPNERFWTH